MNTIYKQFYTSTLFNIKNIIDYSKKTTFINIFTIKDIEVFNKINDKIVIYNNDNHFFKFSVPVFYHVFRPAYKTYGK